MNYGMYACLFQDRNGTVGFRPLELLRNDLLPFMQWIHL